MKQTGKPEELDPVYVIESIPAGGDHKIPARLIAEEMIPTPVHLRLYPEIARGGMGHVHPATDRNLLRHVALKRLDRSLVGEGFHRDGFIAEAQIAGQLEHPNIVPVHELAIDERGVPYFTMKLVQGVNLAQWFADPRRPAGSPDRLEEGIEILLRVCDAIAYAHHRGVVHRDLKPANVMVGAFGQVYVMDWGLARITRTQPASGAGAPMNTPGPVGTPDYMSPEQAAGVPAKMDERCDVFGLGAILYELVTGHRIYGSERDPDVLTRRAVAGDVVPIERVAPRGGLSRRMEAIIAKAVAMRPEDRYQSVEELGRALRDYLRGGLHLPRRQVEGGELILREGDPGDAAYMILAGRCRAYRGSGGREETLAIMAPGDVFGEMALILDEPRAASVQAMEATTLMVIDRRTVEEGLGLEGWTGALVRAMAHRFKNLNTGSR